MLEGMSLEAHSAALGFADLLSRRGSRLVQRERETAASRHGSEAPGPLSSSASDFLMQVEFDPEESARLPSCVPHDVLARIRSEGQLKPGFEY
jgi:hypothetical protein